MLAANIGGAARAASFLARFFSCPIFCGLSSLTPIRCLPGRVYLSGKELPYVRGSLTSHYGHDQTR
jgi:hypothetical protein